MCVMSITSSLAEYNAKKIIKNFKKFCRPHFCFQINCLCLYPHISPPPLFSSFFFGGRGSSFKNTRESCFHKQRFSSQITHIWFFSSMITYNHLNHNGNGNLKKKKTLSLSLSLSISWLVCNEKLICSHSAFLYLSSNVSQPINHKPGLRNNAAVQVSYVSARPTVKPPPPKPPPSKPPPPKPPPPKPPPPKASRSAVRSFVLPVRQKACGD